MYQRVDPLKKGGQKELDEKSWLLETKKLQNLFTNKQLKERK
jgi:hypothetical protein